MNTPSPYEAVIGLEIHAELCTETKLFCTCSARFGAPPNTHICPVCTGAKHTLPRISKSAIPLAVRAGIALGCRIHPRSAFDRKHYAYPDLPKGYQITQYFAPICTSGALTVNGKTFGITRIHMEEDAGKITYDGRGGMQVDLNRCGVPLIEIVTEPDFRSAKEAGDFFRALREILLFAGVCDGKMNEGSLRCDVNLSLHKPGEPFGERCEIKNLNSFRFLEKAIESEIERQSALLSRGETIVRQTLRYDERTGKTAVMRDKEEAEDYRYTPEPDLPPVLLCEDEIEEIRSTMPPLPDEMRAVMTGTYRLTEAGAAAMTESPAIARAFLKAAAHTAFPALIPTLLTEELCPVAPARLGGLCNLLGEEAITRKEALSLALLLKSEDFDPREKAAALGMLLCDDPAPFVPIVAETVAANPEKAAAFRAGNEALFGFFMGQVRRAVSQSGLPTPSPKVLSDLVRHSLTQSEDRS